MLIEISEMPKKWNFKNWINYIVAAWRGTLILYHVIQS